MSELNETQPPVVEVTTDPTPLDRLPAWARYLLVLVIISPLAAGLLLFAAVAAANGINGTADYGDTALDALDLAVKGAAVGLTGWVTMYVLPITRKFGLSSGK